MKNLNCVHNMNKPGTGLHRKHYYFHMIANKMYRPVQNNRIKGMPSGLAEADPGLSEFD